MKKILFILFLMPLVCAGQLRTATSVFTGYTTTATAAGTTTLVVSSTKLQYFTGSTTQTVVLPVTSTLVLGQRYSIKNNSTGLITIQSSGANVITIMSPASEMEITCILTSGTGIASWSFTYNPDVIQAFTLAANHAISSQTGTEVAIGGGTNGGVLLQPGTYRFEYFILAQSATTTVSPFYGINFTGTAAVRTMWMDYADASATLLAALNIADDAGTTGLGFAMRQPMTAFSTTSPNFGHAAGVSGTNTTFQIVIAGALVVTVAGELELWHSSETASSTTIMAGTSVIITRTN